MRDRYEPRKRKAAKRKGPNKGRFVVYLFRF